MNLRIGLFVMLGTFAAAANAAETPKPKSKPKPEFQYKSEGIEISIPTADEPKVTEFNAKSVRAAAKYLEDGAHAWVRERECVACHTSGAYMMERPGLTWLLGKPSEEVRYNFSNSIPDKLPAEKTDGDITYIPVGDRSVWRSLGLAEWDKHVTGELSEATEQSLRDMFARQASHGGFHVDGEVEIPYVTTDFELTVRAARAITSAPGWLANLKDADLRQRVERMKTFLRDSQPRNDYERALKLEVAALMPGLVDKKERDAAMAMLWSKQKADGGWTTRSMSETNNWRTPMTDIVIKLIDGQPDAADPGSDPFMTGLAIVLLRENGVPASDVRLRRGIEWLKSEQRVSGRWWMQSLYRGHYQFSTYIATAQALRALAMCGELPSLVGAE